MTIHSAFHAIGKFVGDAVNSANQFIKRHEVAVGTSLAAAGVLLGPEVPAAIGCALYLMREVSAISRLSDVTPVVSPARRIVFSGGKFVPIIRDDEFHTPSQSPEPTFYSAPSSPTNGNDGDETPRPPTAVYAVKTPTPQSPRFVSPVSDASNADSAISVSPKLEKATSLPSKIPRPVKKDKISGSVQSGAQISAEKLSSSIDGSSPAKGRTTFETFINQVKSVRDNPKGKDILEKLKTLSAFDFENPSKRQEIVKELQALLPKSEQVNLNFRLPNPASINIIRRAAGAK